MKCSDVSRSRCSSSGKTLVDPSTRSFRRKLEWTPTYDDGWVGLRRDLLFVQSQWYILVGTGFKDLDIIKQSLDVILRLSRIVWNRIPNKCSINLVHNKIRFVETRNTLEKHCWRSMNHGIKHRLIVSLPVSVPGWRSRRSVNVAGELNRSGQRLR